MKVQSFLLSLGIVTSFLLFPPDGKADLITLRDGTQLEGIIKRVAEGKVTIEVNGEEAIKDILDVRSMDFTTPHLPADSNAPVSRFLRNVEAQEIVHTMEELDRTANEVRSSLAEISGYWKSRQPISPEEETEWEASKETFRRELARYQELLNKAYSHLLHRVDEYNGIAGQANRLYVGVKGVFNVGSSLVSKESATLPLRHYVPGNWYDTIYYRGYKDGYGEAWAEYSSGSRPQP